MNLQKSIRYDFGTTDLYAILESQLADNQILKFGSVYMQLRRDLNSRLHNQLILELQFPIREGVIIANNPHSSNETR